MLCGWDALRPTCRPAVGILVQFVIRLWLHSLLALEGILQTQQEVPLSDDSLPLPLCPAAQQQGKDHLHPGA